MCVILTNLHHKIYCVTKFTDASELEGFLGVEEVKLGHENLSLEFLN
jgi:hypothetical protein